MMQKLIFLIISIALLQSCNNKTTEIEELPSDSIFHLTSNWQNQHGEDLKLNDLRGKTLVVVMIYTSCQVACPILVADMKKIENQINKKYLNKTSLVLVTIDPENDTPDVLKKFAETRDLTEAHWVFLRSNSLATQEFANVLSMKYKKISPIDFSHSNIISVFDPNGTLVMQEEGTGINSKKVADKVNDIVKNS